MQDLGSGAFGKVKLAIKQVLNEEKKFAVKIMKKSSLMKKREFFVDIDGSIIF